MFASFHSSVKILFKKYLLEKLTKRGLSNQQENIRTQMNAGVPDSTRPIMFSAFLCANLHPFLQKGS